MAALNIHQIQDASPRRSRIFQQVLNGPLQYDRVIVRLRELVQQHRLPAARFPPPEHNNLYTRNSLEQFVLCGTVQDLLMMTSKPPRFNLYNCEACPIQGGSVRPDSSLASYGRREC